MGAKTEGIVAGRRSFCAEHKPGHPDAYDLRLLNNERRKNDLLTEENDSLRKEIGRLNDKFWEIYCDIEKIFNKWEKR